MSKQEKCPFFMRRVSSYRFYGIKCCAHFSNGQTHGDIALWDKDYREKRIAEHCHGNYQECVHYKGNEERNGRRI